MYIIIAQNVLYKMEENNEEDNYSNNSNTTYIFDNQIDQIDQIENIHEAVYNIMIDFKNYIYEEALPLLEDLDYLYLFDYIEEITKD